MGYTAGLSPLQHTWADRLLVHFLRYSLRRGAPEAEADEHELAAPILSKL